MNPKTPYERYRNLADTMKDQDYQCVYSGDAKRANLQLDMILDAVLSYEKSLHCKTIGTEVFQKTELFLEEISRQLMTANDLCNALGIPPVFTGDLNNEGDLTEFAIQFCQEYGQRE